MAVEVATLQFKADTKQLERSEKHLRDLGTESKKTEKSVEKLRKKLKQSANDSRYYGESTKKAVVGTRKLGKAFVGLAASLGLVAGAVKTVSIAREFDIINASLKTMTGSQAAADKAFTRIQEFAATTPFDLQQVAGAFVKLKSLGLEPSEEALLSYGNTASAMGYSLNQMVEAVADASTMEFERLKAFGIKAKQSADEVTFIFQGVSTSVKKNSNDIQEYLLAIGQTEFAGAMAERAKTLDGAISNLGDTFDSLFLTIAQGDQGIMNDVVRGMEGALARIRDAIALTNGTASLDLQLGEVQRDLEYYEQQIEASGEFLANLLGLTDKRDEILAERQRLLDEIAKQNKEAAESEAAAARKAAIEKLYTDKELADAARAEALKDAADFIKQLEYLKMFKPDKVIIQLGIVDCVPRALTERENHFVNKFWILKKIAIVYLKYKKKKLRGKRGICYTNEKDFAKGLSLIKKSFKNVFCLSIVKPCLVYEEKIPGVRHNVDLYNDILKKTFSENYIDVNDMDGTCIMSDHHHLNTKGHDYVFNKIKDRVLKEEEKEEKEEEMNNN